MTDTSKMHAQLGELRRRLMLLRPPAGPRSPVERFKRAEAIATEAVELLESALGELSAEPEGKHRVWLAGELEKAADAASVDLEPRHRCLSVLGWVMGAAAFDLAERERFIERLYGEARAPQENTE